MEQRELSLADILTGLEFGQLIAQAQARVRALVEGQGVYVAYLRTKYECDGEGWEFNDWAQGFVRPVAVEEAGEVEEDG